MRFFGCGGKKDSRGRLSLRVCVCVGECLREAFLRILFWDIICEIEDGDILAEGFGYGIGGAACGGTEVGDAIIAIL